MDEVPGHLLMEMILELREDLLVQDMLLKAVIATLPQRAEVHAALQVILSSHESLQLDRGFELGLSAEDAGQMRLSLKAKTDQLLAYLQAS